MYLRGVDKKNENSKLSLISLGNMGQKRCFQSITRKSNCALSKCIEEWVSWDAYRCPNCGFSACRNVRILTPVQQANQIYWPIMVTRILKRGF
jgi:hypothetical protein